MNCPPAVVIRPVPALRTRSTRVASSAFSSLTPSSANEKMDAIPKRSGMVKIKSDVAWFWMIWPSSNSSRILSASGGGVTSKTSSSALTAAT